MTFTKFQEEPSEEYTLLCPDCEERTRQVVTFGHIEEQEDGVNAWYDMECQECGQITDLLRIREDEHDARMNLP